MTKQRKPPEIEIALPTGFTVLERAVIYARVSSDDTRKDGRNLAGQLEMGREYATQKGYNIVAELAEDDRGASGSEIDLPQLNRIREMAQARQVDVLVVRELDRLSRSLAKQLIVEEELKRTGVRVEYVLADYEDTPEGTLSKHLRATIAEYEREKIRERMMRGKRLKAKAGNVIVNGRPPYGYKLVRQGDRTMLEIIEEEAKIVRLIFYWFIEGDERGKPLSIYEIRKKLIEMGIPTPADNEAVRGRGRKKRQRGIWNRESVRAILKNETYTGKWYFGKNRRGNQPNPVDTWIAVDVPVIITRNIWEIVQMKLQENKQNAKRNLKYNYLFAKRVTCGECGCKMTGRSRNSGKYQYYVCPTKAGPDYIRNCNQPHFRTRDVDAVVWEWLESFLTDPAVLDKGLADYQASRDKENEPLRLKLQAAEASIEKNNQDLEELLRGLKVLKGRRASRAKANILNDIERIEKALDDLETERARLLQLLGAHSLSEEQIKDIKAYAAEVAKDLETLGQDFEGRRRLIEMLDVNLTLVVENGQKVAYVQSKLGDKSLSIVPKSTRTNITLNFSIG